MLHGTCFTIYFFHIIIIIIFHVVKRVIQELYIDHVLIELYLFCWVFFIPQLIILNAKLPGKKESTKSETPVVTRQTVLRPAFVCGCAVGVCARVVTISTWARRSGLPNEPY